MPLQVEALCKARFSFRHCLPTVYDSLTFPVSPTLEDESYVGVVDEVGE